MVTGRESTEIYAPELFCMEPEPRLIGRKCTQCGKIWFPPPKICPKCHGKSLERYLLSSKGKVYSFSVVHVPPDPCFEAPYVLAYVEFPEDLYVFGQVDCSSGIEKLRIGSEVRVSYGIIRRNQETGKPVISYKFELI